LFRKPALLEEILQYGHLPKDVIDAYREHARKEATKD
jgi:hypothetical protein